MIDKIAKIFFSSTIITCFMVIGILFILLISGLCGCGEAANTMKHLKSSFTGLNRHVALYDANGKIIKEWDVDAKIEDQGGTVYFLDANGKAVTISGTFIIEEK